MISRFGMLAVLPGLLSAQAVVEYALGSARAATSAAPAQKASKAAAAVYRRAGPAKAQKRRPSPAAARQAWAAPVKAQLTKAFDDPPPNAVLEDPSGIEKGITYGEVLRRFGLPVFKLTSGPGQETLSYTRNNQTIDVQIRDGKVAAVVRAP